MTNNGSIIADGATFTNAYTVGGSLNVINGAVDVNEGTLEAANDASITFATGADGTLKAKASDFGDIPQAGEFTKGTNVAKQLTNNGELILTA